MMHDLDTHRWLVVKDTPKEMVLVSRATEEIRILQK